MGSKGAAFAAAALGMLVLAGSDALGGSHTWDVNELFSNADGTIQFIELRETGGGNFETGVGGHDITSNTNTFTIPSNVPAPTGFRHLLFATAGFAALPGAPAPDHIIKPNFFSVGADRITYVPWDFLSFGTGQLPTDGIHSLNRDPNTGGISTGVNSPTNYANQTGSVDARPQPPGVPDGSAGSMPMTVVSVDPSGASMTISWDATTCSGASDHHIIYGQGSDLPAGAGAPFRLTGSVCGIASPPFTWNPTPSATDGTGLIWWLIAVSDGAGTEGSWGKDSSGNERTGPGPDGSSGQCGITSRSVSNTCGH